MWPIIDAGFSTSNTVDGGLGGAYLCRLWLVGNRRQVKDNNWHGQSQCNNKIQIQNHQNHQTLF